jgi:hypothetical protein
MERDDAPVDHREEHIAQEEGKKESNISSSKWKRESNRPKSNRGGGRRTKSSMINNTGARHAEPSHIIFFPDRPN